MVQSRNVGTAEIAIRGNKAPFRRDMRETERIARTSGRRVSQSFDRANRSVTVLNNSLVRSRTSMLALGAAAGIAFASATRLVANFEQSMSTVQAVTGATAEQFDALTARARELGATTRFTASQAAEGMIELARAGFSVDEVLGSVEGTLKLAQAGALDLGRAAEITASTLRGMQLDVDETARVVDVLAAAANSSNTNVSQLGDGLKFVTPIAASLGVSLEETTGALQALADAGFRGELGGTGLRKVMISLEKQSNQGIEILAKYGLTLDDVSVSSNGLTPALERLAAAGITTGEAMTLFGLRGGPAFEILRSSVPKVESATKALEGAAGTADRIAEVMDDNLNGAILRAVSALQELTIALADTGPAQGLENALIGLADLLRLAADNADLVAVAFVALAARAMLPLVVSVLPRAIAGVAALGAQLSLIAFKAGPAAAALTGMSAALAAVGGPATLAIIAAAAAFLTLARNAEQGRKAIADAERAIQGAQQALNETQKYDDTFLTLSSNAFDAIPIFDELAASIRGVANALDDATVAGFVNESTTLYNSLRENVAVLEELQRLQENALASQVRDPTLAGQDRVAAARQLGLETEFDDDVRKAQQAVAILELRLKAIGQNVFGEIDVLEALRNGGLDELEQTLKARLEKINEDAGINIGEAAATGATQALDDGESDRLQEILDLEYRLDLARTQGDKAEIARLEDKLDIISRTQDLVRAGLTLADAEVKAREQVNALRSAENDEIQKRFALERDLAIRDVVGGGLVATDETEDEIDFTRERLRRSVSDALVDAIQGGNWQDALGRAFYEVIAENIRDAFDEVLDYLGEALKQIFKGDNLSGILGGVGDFFGNRASGGSVGAGRRYLIGERGPEMFVPSTDGYVVSNEDLRASGNAGRMTGMGGVGIRMGDINVYGDPSGRTLKLLEESQKRQAEQLPGLIDQRVMESSSRGRYG